LLHRFTAALFDACCTEHLRMLTNPSQLFRQCAIADATQASQRAQQLLRWPYFGGLRAQEMPMQEESPRCNNMIIYRYASGRHRDDLYTRSACCNPVHTCHDNISTSDLRRLVLEAMSRQLTSCPSCINSGGACCMEPFRCECGALRLIVDAFLGVVTALLLQRMIVGDCSGGCHRPILTNITVSYECGNGMRLSPHPIYYHARVLSA
jgi:hypothetical protein